MHFLYVTFRQFVTAVDESFAGNDVHLNLVHLYPYQVLFLYRTASSVIEALFFGYLISHLLSAITTQ